jgi:hypothetical protein
MTAMPATAAIPHSHETQDTRINRPCQEIYQAVSGLEDEVSGICLFPVPEETSGTGKRLIMGRIP